jgi:Holliday junction resolvasome RuvABC endonuclease subunit
MREISVDASTTCTGWAVWEDDVLIDYGKIKPDKKLFWRDRLKIMVKELSGIICKYKPTKAYQEEVPLAPKGGIKTAVLLGVTQGAILALYWIYNIEYTFINVGTWRHDIGINTGDKNRDSKKIRSINKANELFGLDLKCVFTKGGKYDGDKSDDDIADAILVKASTVPKYCQKPIIKGFVK